MYQTVIEKERRGDYLGKTVQMVPHLTDAIQGHIERVSQVPVDDTNEEPDVCIIELGGTVGDLESAVFVQALTQLRRKAGKRNFMQIHVSLVPVINGELKTKPTQHAIKDVRREGLNPDLIACRCAQTLDKDTIDKIAAHCIVETNQVVQVTDVASLYHVPLLLESQGLIKLVSDILRLREISPSSSLVKRGAETWNAWKELTISQEHALKTVSIALVGKYTNHPDSYHSVVKSLEHAAMACTRKLDLIMVDADHLEKRTEVDSPQNYYQAWHRVHSAEGILVPGGFGERGSEGMIAAIKTCREKKKPFLGICLGLQLAAIEYARNKCGLEEAMSAEFNGNAVVPLVISMPEVDKVTMGATQRLGIRPTIFQPGSDWSKLYKLYRNNASSSIPSVNDNSELFNHHGQNDNPTIDSSFDNLLTADVPALQKAPISMPTVPLIIKERHRHRYEVNPDYVETLEAAGLSFIGRDEEGKRMEILELKDHPYFVAVQYHPEYLSRVLNPSKPFLGLVAASAGILPEIMTGQRSRVSSIFNGVNL